MARMIEDAFQSTHPVRGATKDAEQHFKDYVFQSTHPVRGATLPLAFAMDDDMDFNPRTP